MKPVQKDPTPISSFNHPVSVRELKDIVSYFPIGQHVKYYPEYQTQMTMESIVLGYEINGHMIYSQNHLEVTGGAEQGGRIILHLEDKERELSKVDSFCIILPGKAGEEYKLNFLSKASLGSRGQFRNGNTITLVARYQERGVITMETSVRESVIPKEGYYRNHQLALLQVEATSLEVSEQRTHHRLMCNLPVEIQVVAKEQSHSCILVNYSEVSAKIKFNSDVALKSLLNEGDRLIMNLTLDQGHRTFVIGGSVMRCHQDSIVMTLQDIMVDGELRPFELMQALNVKSSLLQYPGIG